MEDLQLDGESNGAVCDDTAGRKEDPSAEPWAVALKKFPDLIARADAGDETALRDFLDAYDTFNDGTLRQFTIAQCHIGMQAHSTFPDSPATREAAIRDLQASWYRLPWSDDPLLHMVNEFTHFTFVAAQCAGIRDANLLREKAPLDVRNSSRDDFNSASRRFLRSASLCAQTRALFKKHNLERGWLGNDDEEEEE
jgi:hypothetical protein